MKYRRRRSPTAKELAILLVLGLAAAIVVFTLVGADIRLSGLLRGGGDFFSAWHGLRDLALRQASPYGLAAAAEVQELAYGRQAAPGQNPFFLTTPFFLVLLYVPLAIIPDAVIARGAWLFLSQLALIGTVLVSVVGTAWRPPRWLLAAQAVVAIFGAYAVLSILDGSPAIALGLLYSGALWAYVTDRDEVAGALAALSLSSWESGSVFLVLFTWRVFHDRRWGVLGGFGMTFIVLVIISFLIYPHWYLPFLTAVIGSARTSYGYSTQSVLARLVPSGGERIAQTTSVALGVLMIYEWAMARGADIRRFVWLACLALAVSPLLGYRSELSNLVVLWPAVSLISSAAVARGRPHYWLSVIVLAALFVVPWVLLARWQLAHDVRAGAYLYLFYPALCIVGLYWTRWWFLRRGNTWLDEINRSAR